MKRSYFIKKENEYSRLAERIILALAELKVPSNISYSTSSVSVYVDSAVSDSEIRISDHPSHHGSYKYNFIKSIECVSTFSKGCYFYQLSDEGIEAFLEDYKLNEQLPDEQLISVSKQYEMRSYVIHKQTGLFLIKKKPKLFKPDANIQKRLLTFENYQLLSSRIIKRLSGCLSTKKTFFGIDLTKDMIMNRIRILGDNSDNYDIIFEQVEIEDD